MRWGFYLMSIACCGVLAAIMWERGQIWWAIGMVVIALLYLTRGLVSQHKERKEILGEMRTELAGKHTTAEKKAILDDLLTTRSNCRKSRAWQMIGGMIVVIGVVVVYPSNPPLALAMAVMLLPLAWMIWRNTSKITKIEQGLRARNLLT